MAAKRTNHIHRLRRHTYKATGNSVFFCTLSDCTYKIETQFSLGKETICNRCGKPFEMTTYAMRLAKPHCMDCHKTITGDKTNVSTKILDAILPESTLDRRSIPTRRSSEIVIKPEESINELRSKLDEIPSITYREIKVEGEDPEL